MNEIQGMRFYGADIVARLHNGTDHLQSFFASATEKTLRDGIKDRLAAVDEDLSDTLLYLEFLRDGSTRRPSGPLLTVIKVLDVARCRQEGVRRAVAEILKIRKASDALTRRLGAGARNFLAIGPHQKWVGDYLDTLLVDNVRDLETVRADAARIIGRTREMLPNSQPPSVVDLLPAKDARWRNAIIAIQEVRCLLLIMFGDLAGADLSYQAVLELLTGAQQPAPTPSELRGEQEATA